MHKNHNRRLKTLAWILAAVVVTNLAIAILTVITNQGT